MVQCKCCGQHIMFPNSAERRDVWDGKKYITYYFCNTFCMYDWYIKNLNTVGM